MRFNQVPEARGLYDPGYEHDNCGVGFLCDIQGRASRDIVSQALEVLRRMSHRGAVGADPDSGDGAGILLQMPQAFMAAECAKLGIPDQGAGHLATGLFFLSPDPVLKAKLTEASESACRASGLKVLGWRDVPVRPRIIGETARKAMPDFKMPLIAWEGPDFEPAAFERRLYLARKRAERTASTLEKGKGFFYVASLSAKKLAYKGMLTPEQLPEFFPDLTDPLMASAIALIHSRYSTNTFPSWDLAQPFRFLAHNGEINTLKGNVTWMEARESLLKSDLFGADLAEVLPVIQPGGSDSSALDNALELLCLSGRPLAQAMMTLVPAAWEADARMDGTLRDFYRYQRCLTESWDGPAALAFTDGESIAAALDRNGLRPARYVITTDGRALMASEMGALDVDPALIEYSGRLEPGKILYIDTKSGRVVSDAEVKSKVAARAPYGQWLADNLQGLAQAEPVRAPEFDDRLLKAASYTREEMSMIIQPMASTGAEPIGSMGNDAPLAVLSLQRQSLYGYFRQLFAQVTNPPIDPIREGCVMSLETVLGKSGNLLKEGPEAARRLTLEKPVMTEETLARFKADFAAETADISLTFDASRGQADFDAELDRVCAQAEAAVAAGKTYILLSDRGIGPDRSALPSLAAVGAVHRRLIAAKRRSLCSIILDSVIPREVHHFCVLFGYGADAVVPYGAYAAIAKLIAEEELPPDFPKAVRNYLHAVEHGLMKVLSKMGISTLMSYKGAQIFEAVGLGEKIVRRCFTGTPSRVGGIGLADLAAETLAAHKAAYVGPATHILPSGGQYRWRKDGEVHAWNPDTVAALQQAVRSGSYDKYKEYAALMDGRGHGPVTLRSLLRFKAASPVPLEEVESEDSLVKRFATGAMSFGSISAGAHETMAIAMNRLGGKSNTGEGGEDPRRFARLPNGDSLRSEVKQVASGRFGVTTLYLSNASEIQIKIAQGAKPGEGGQLPGHKVSQIIAKTRYTTPGVTLISPPPHHDIYSIEDLAQLILDLKNVNPQARVSVKLVSEMGVGTVAAGVAKGKAEMILISGGDGGTGASPLSSIKHAGLPWELGLSETHQTLVMNGLRSRVRIQCDGGMRTGRDIAIACLLGAEEFGFAAAALISMGCTMLRHCHLNNCSMGVATQDERCAARFQGKPEYVENFMRFTARYLREIMASLGFRRLEDMVGQTQLLEADPAALTGKAAGIDFSKILWKPESADKPYRDPAYVHPDMRQALDKRLIELTKEAVESGKPVALDLPIGNVDRCAGAQLSGRIMKAKGEQALPPGTITVNFSGTAGQSFGAWLCKGVSFRLKGLANDYVGKGLFGGSLAISPPSGSRYDPSANVIIGNTALYGAISGELFASGRAGERFCVRNSGATAVAEGAGDHCCEYMTGGTALILGPTGRNFGAGMSGGVAYVWDPDGTFPQRFNPELADIEAMTEEDARKVRGLLERHRELTGSKRAADILADFAAQAAAFRKVMPRDYKAYLASQGGK